DRPFAGRSLRLRGRPALELLLAHPGNDRKQALTAGPHVPQQRVDALAHCPASCVAIAGGTLPPPLFGAAAWTSQDAPLFEGLTSSSSCSRTTTDICGACAGTPVISCAPPPTGTLAWNGCWYCTMLLFATMTSIRASSRSSVTSLLIAITMSLPASQLDAIETATSGPCGVLGVGDSSGSGGIVGVGSGTSGRATGEVSATGTTAFTLSGRRSAVSGTQPRRSVPGGKMIWNHVDSSL